MGWNETIFGMKYQELFLRIHQLNHTEMFMGTQIYIRYIVVSIVLITFMLAIELLYHTQLFSFLDCFFEQLPLFITIGLWYTLDKV